MRRVKAVKKAVLSTLILSLALACASFIAAGVGFYLYMRLDIINAFILFMVSLSLLAFSAGLLGFIYSFYGLSLTIALALAVVPVVLMVALCIVATFSFFVLVPFKVKVVTVYLGLWGALLGITGWVRLYREVVGA